jgi:hypothetical protein
MLEIERDNLVAKNKKLRAALDDCISGYVYIEDSYGRMYGIGWERIYEYAELVGRTKFPGKTIKR